MPRLTEEQVIELENTKDIWKVSYRESERGWGQDTWDAFFDSYEEAYEEYVDTNKQNNKDYVPDYYIVAYEPQKVTVKTVIQ
jgi:hypothetical protein